MKETTYLYAVDVDGGKYTFRLDKEGHLDVLRHGEPWWTPTEGSKAIISLMDGEEKRQQALATVNQYLSTALDPNVVTMLRVLRSTLTDE